MDQQDKKKNFRGDGKKPFNRDGKKPYSQDGKKPYSRDGKKTFNRDGDRKKSFGRDGEGKKSFNRDGKRGDGRRFDKPEQKKSVPQGPSARDVALKALKNVFRDNAYASQALDRELSAVHLNDDDRRLASSMFYFTLENRLRITVGSEQQMEALLTALKELGA